MNINLKNIVLFSSTLAVLLNIWQFASSYQQRQAAFAPAFANTARAATTATEAATSSQVPATQAPLPVATVTPVATPTAPVINPGAAGIAATLASAGLKSQYAALYLAVQQSSGTPWQLLAAVHRVESGQSDNTSRTSYAGATGPMQFMPATFNHYAVDADGGGADITDLDDSMYTAGRYLAADGAADGRYTNALYGYNHSYAYVSHVMDIANSLGL